MKMTGERLRSQCLPSNAESSYVKVVIDNQLTGNAFACRWKYNGKVICWVTQLVVDRNYRERGLATGLLSELKRESDDVYGILTSHAAACLAAAKTYGSKSAAGKILRIKANFYRRYQQRSTHVHQRSRSRNHRRLSNPLH